MKAKRFLAIFLSVAMLMTVLAIPASAATVGEYLYAEMGGGATVSSFFAQKTTTGDFYYTARANGFDGWSKAGDEWVYFRGRITGGMQATALAHRNYYGSEVSGKLPYLSGYGALNGYYKIAIQYDSSNPNDWVNLYVTWTP